MSVLAWTCAAGLRRGTRALGLLAVVSTLLLCAGVNTTANRQRVSLGTCSIKPAPRFVA